MNLSKVSSVLSMEDEIDRDEAILDLLRSAAPNDSIRRLEEVASHIVDPFYKAQAYIYLFRNLRDKDLQKAFGYLQRSYTSALDSYEFWQPAEVLFQIGVLYVENDQTELAVEMLNGAVVKAQKCIERDPLQDGLSCADILGEISLKFLEMGMDERAMEIASEIPFEESRYYALLKLTSK